MKFLVAWLITAVAAFAINVGDTYEQVVAERGKPKSQASVGPNRILNYAEGSIQLRDNAVVLIKLPNNAAPKSSPARATPPPAPEPETPITDPDVSEQRIPVLENQRLSAINRVKSIINQPVPAQKRTHDMLVSVFSPGWFHDGATTPNFDTVDVRQTQELTYDKHQYVGSDLNPSAVYTGRDLEFNPMTKYFYVDRSVPKKKLTEAEMVEINRLYRVIGKCDAQLKKLEAQAP
ncbi:MAG: hypothetical protein ABIV50_01375 [Opitutus sp.]